MAARDELSEAASLSLSDLINRVLDKGVVLTGSVKLSVANIELVEFELSLFLQAVETGLRRVAPAPEHGADLPLLPPPAGE